MLGINLGPQCPIVRILRIVQTDRLLTRAIVQVALRCEATTVDTCIVSPDRAQMLVWNQVLVELRVLGRPSELKLAEIL